MRASTRPRGTPLSAARAGTKVVLAVLAGAVLLFVGFGSAEAGESQGEGDPVTGEAPAEPAGATPITEVGVSPAETQLRANADPAMVAAGEQLYLTSCVSCHGVGGVGTDEYPSLVGVGAASADFYLRTGRMPLAFPVPQPPEKPKAFTDEEIVQLVAYVSSLGDGPPIPDVNPDDANLQNGGALYLANCAACHNSQGIGGALSYGAHAPDLLTVEPTQIGEAVRTGPGQMPVFGPDTLSDTDLDDIIRYIQYLQHPEAAGGLKIGSTGPVTEGFVAWLVGLGVLILVIRWITREHRSHA